MKRPLLTGGIVVLLHLSCQPVSNSNDLVFDPPVDTVYNFTVSSQLTQLREGSNPPFSNTEEVSFSLQCQQKDDNLRQMQLVINGVRFSSPSKVVLAGNRHEKVYLMNKPGVMQDTFSTTTVLSTEVKETGKLPYEQFKIHLCRLAVGNVLNITMNKNGDVLKVSGFDELADSVASAANVNKGLVRKLLLELFGHKAIQEMLLQMFYYLPGKPASQGESWVKNFVLQLKAPVKYSNMVTVQQVRNDTVTLQVKSVVSTKAMEGGTVIEEGVKTETIVAGYSTGIVYSIRADENRVMHTDNYDIKRQRIFIVKREK